MPGPQRPKNLTPPGIGTDNHDFRYTFKIRNIVWSVYSFMSTVSPAANPVSQSITSHPFHGIVENEGRTYRNWGLSLATIPAVYVEPVSYADVCAVVRDVSRFPTPV